MLFYCIRYGNTPPQPPVSPFEHPTLSLHGLLDALQLEIEASPGLIPLFANELRRELDAHLAEAGSW